MPNSPPMEKVKNHPGIYRRGGRYVVVYRDNLGRQRKQFAVTLAEARDVKAAKRTDIRRGEYRELSRLTLAEYAAQWIDTYTGRTKRGFGEGSRADYRDALERDILPLLGRLQLTQIEATDIKELARQLAGRGLAQSSVRKTIAPLKALLATAVEDRLLRFNPAAGVRIAQPTDTADEDHVKALTEDELERLIAAAPAEWRLFLRFLFETGCRIGEAIELRWSDLAGDVLHVDRRFYRGRLGLPKGRKKRRIRLSHSMGQAMWARRRELRPQPNDLLFPAGRGQRLDPSNLMSRMLKPAAVNAGLGKWVTVKGRDGKDRKRAETWVGFHTLRHTSATALFRRGWNAKQVQVYLGHSDPGFTLRTYVHLLEDDLPQPDFAVLVGNAGATQAPETDRNEEVVELAAIAV